MVADSECHLYQPLLIWNREIKVKFHKETLAYPIYAPYVFKEPSHATNFLSDYIKELIERGDLPKDVILEDGNVDESKLKTAVVDVALSTLESIDTEDEVI